ncbi:MAG: porin [Chthonomonadaceae bacterium]|nr:porin [Chthonomonadaceae bacterium]
MDNKNAVVLYDPIWKSYKEGHALSLYGFLQSRITDSKNANGDLSPTRAEVTRLRPTVSFTPDKFWDFHVQFDLSTRGRPLNSVNGRDVYIEYHNTDYFTRVGQSKVPFGYEVWQEGDEARATVERARVMATLFPGERDTGVWFGTVEPVDPKHPKKRLVRPTYTVALLTGNGIDKYYDGVGKAISARARIPVHTNLAFDISLFTGRSNQPKGVDKVKQAFGLGVQGLKGRVGAQAEFLWGRAFGHNLYGGYEQVSYDTKIPGVFFARHDIYDPNTSAGGSMWNRESLGLYKDIGNLRLTGEYDFVTNKAVAGNSNLFSFQLQMLY